MMNKKSHKFLLEDEVIVALRLCEYPSLEQIYLLPFVEECLQSVAEVQRCASQIYGMFA
jgi:hypothetical protein